MTTTLERPPLRPPARQDSPERSPLGPGVVAATWAAGAGLVALGIPLLLVWATDSRSGSGAAAATRAVGQLWLLGHGTSMGIPGGHVGLVPLGLALLPLALLHRAGRHGARTVEVRGLTQAVRLVVAVAFPYAVLCAVVAAASATTTVRPAPVQATLGGLVLAVLGAGSGALREAGLFRTALSAVPFRARGLLRATSVAVAVLVAGGAVVAGISFARHAGRASSLAAASDPGLVGGLALLVLGVVCVPNAALWGSAWLTGPGFAVGVGTSVGPFGTTLGEVPAFPLLAALPAGPAPTWLGVVALAVPVGAGALGGVVLARRLSCGAGRAALEGLALGPCVGLALGTLAWLSGGPLGGGRLVEVGPTPWQVGLAAMVETGLAAAVAASVVRRH
ncbi:MAG TPA: DUF6350 family protein [Mycobacteriales bacterium]|nr:DUF6350 family protein [Mycobacteriales bacterium]